MHAATVLRVSEILHGRSNANEHHKTNTVVKYSSSDPTQRIRLKNIARRVLSWKQLARGSCPDQLNYPCVVALSAMGDILVCYQSNHRIHIFSPNGKSVKYVGSYRRYWGSAVFLPAQFNYIVAKRLACCSGLAVSVAKYT